jgi:geranylgeranyl reductase
VGDAAGTVTKSSGEGIYFAAKSARMCAETIVERSQNGRYVPTEDDLKLYLQRWDQKYGMTYRVMDLLQRVFYRSDATREAFVEMCADKDVQKMTFDSYLYKTVAPANPLTQMKVTAKTLGSLMRGNALAP